MTLAWGLAWLLGVTVILVSVAELSARYHRRDLDAELALHAMAAYGLAWIDENGRFHDEFFRREPLLAESPFDIWMVAPGDPPVVHFRPRAAKYDIASLGDLARRVVETTDEVTRDGHDESGKPYRLHAIPSFDDSDIARMAIFVIGDPQPSTFAHREFIRHIVLRGLIAALIGLGVGAWMASRSLAPVMRAYRQKERFLSGAAHELRAPVASLRAICESAAAGDESASKALVRILPVVLKTGELVDDLLLYARLGSESASVTREALRLDLLAETCVPDDDSVRLETSDCVVLGDAGLLRVAIHNLVVNAVNHAQRKTTGCDILVRVSDGVVVVEDDGPGFAPELLPDAMEPFVTSRDGPGVGLGLALARLIAEIHGGVLTLENRPAGGARVTFSLPPAKFS